MPERYHGHDPRDRFKGSPAATINQIDGERILSLRTGSLIIAQCTEKKEEEEEEEEEEDALFFRMVTTDAHDDSSALSQLSYVDPFVSMRRIHEEEEAPIGVDNVSPMSSIVTFAVGSLGMGLYRNYFTNEKPTCTVYNSSSPVQ
ncbi:hypothetical protein ALC56_07790 [Trachymyrmex septentrionalis]|uniref:Uncharacterized protein n=1 Tax=Trachymyrmex septentrionalis TaxID=34720 RepID=A0A195FB33_9HYME|nr:hypothetical protein ALC56_07790 [Trachymyrmex septentrionalis]